MVPAGFKKESKKEGSALEELRTEAGGDPDETGVASEGQTRRIKPFGFGMYGIFSVE
jgi:hypothetical protein